MELRMLPPNKFAAGIRDNSRFIPICQGVWKQSMGLNILLSKSGTGEKENDETGSFGNSGAQQIAPERISRQFAVSFRIGCKG
jgi:hypothetical protein